MTNPLVDLHQAICQNSRTDRLTILGPRNIEMYDKSSACPPSSRVSPFCLQQSPTGRATLGSRTLSDVASLCHLSLWCKKTERTSDCVQILVLGAPFLGALRLAFRHATSKCLYKNASNRPYVSKNAIN